MRYLRRAVWYIASRLFLLSTVLGLIVVTFYFAMNFSNIQVILKDGMAARAKYVMGIEEDADILSKYFQSNWLQNDSLVLSAQQGNSAYIDYKVIGIDHRLDLGFFWTWPWDTSVRVNISESIPKIDGRVKGTRADAVIAAGGENAVYPPSWQDAKYKVNLVKENGQWKIRNLTLQEP